MATVRGGDRLKAALDGIETKLKSASVVRVGFLSNATYPDGTPVALIAAIQDFGAPSRNIPPRPFFRNMIAAKKGEWPDAVAKLLKQNNLDAKRTLDQMGEGIKGQLAQSIVDTNSPALKEKTVARKGFAKPLIDSGHMLQSIDYETK